MPPGNRKGSRTATRGRARKSASTGDGNSIRDRLFDFKREQILEVAERLFYERGFKSTTLDAIAAELSVTKPFIYYHFHNKQDILHVLVERTMQRNAEVFGGVDIEQGSPTELLRELCRRVVMLVIDSRTSIAMFWREQKEVPEDEKRFMHEMKQRHDAQLERIIERGAQCGEFAVEDPKLTVLAIQGMINWIYTWYRPGGRLSPESIAERIADLAVRTVTAGNEAAIRAPKHRADARKPARNRS